MDEDNDIDSKSSSKKQKIETIKEEFNNNSKLETLKEEVDIKSHDTLLKSTQFLNISNPDHKHFFQLCYTLYKV